MPGRTARSGAGFCSDDPRTQFPRPVWVCDAGLCFVPFYKGVPNLSDFFTKLLETDTLQRLRDAMMTEQRMPDAETFG